jgi:threonine/homoserine/homoserine lactone efflux protein
MDWINALSFVAVASLLVMSPGPNGVLIAKTVPTSGRAAGFANIAGFIAAFYLHGTLSILGISAILMASSQVFFIVKLMGAAYLCWLGFKALRDAIRGNNAAQIVDSVSQQRNLRSAFVEGLLTNALNPKVSMFYLAAFPQFITTGEGAITSAFTLVILHSLIAAIWFSAMVVLFARLARVAQNGAFQRWLKGVTGVVFVGFGIKLATYRP